MNVMTIYMQLIITYVTLLPSQGFTSTSVEQSTPFSLPNMSPAR